MDLTSREGDWFLDELCSMSGNVNQLLLAALNDPSIVSFALSPMGRDSSVCFLGWWCFLGTCRARHALCIPEVLQHCVFDSSASCCQQRHVTWCCTL